MTKWTLSLISVILLFASCKKNSSTTDKFPHTPEDDQLHLNEIQIIASHNSYRTMTTDTIFNYLVANQAILPSSLDPHDLDYTHLDFNEQLSNYKMRGLEIDIYNDPNGGAFANRKMNSIVGLPEASGVPALSNPGFKVLHIKDVDYNTHYFTFKQSLIALKNWSDAHPHHLPIFVNVETKQDAPGDNALLQGLGFQKAPVWDLSATDKLDQEVKDVFGQNLDQIITPDKLRGSLATLNNVVTQKKWPTLYDSRGKIVFIMEGAADSLYMLNHPSLSGRTMFVYSEPGNPETAFVILNGSVSDFTEIQQRVNEGYIVRTRCDAGTTEARTGDYSSMNAAFTSGAQISSTDYYRPDPRGGIDPGWSTYYVKFPNGELARKNPVNATQINVSSSLTE